MPEHLVPAGPPPTPALPPQHWVEAPAPVQQSRPPFERPLAAVRRYKFLILSVLLVAVAAGVVATRLVVPQYEVQAQVWIESGTPQQGQVGPIRSQGLLNDQAWVELFRSYRISDAVVRKLNLFLQPKDLKDTTVFTGFMLADRFVAGTYELEIDRSRKRWTLSHQSAALTETGTAADSVGARAGFKWLLPASAFAGSGARKVKFTVSTPRETSIALTNNLDPRLAEKSSFLWIKFRDRDGQLAARTLNTWVNEYVTVAGELKKRNVVEFANILSGQLMFSEKALHDAESALENFRVHTITLPTEGSPVAAGVEATRDPALRAFFEKKIEFDNLRHDADDLEKTIANAGEGVAPFEAALLIPSVAQSPGAEALRKAFKDLYENQAKLAALRLAYTDQMPQVQDLIKSVNNLKGQTIPHLARQLLEQLKQRQGEFDQRITGASRELQAIPTRTIEEMRLRRAVSIADGLYTTLKARAAEAQLAAAGAQPDVRVIDTAVAPLRPTKNTAPRIMMMAIVGGLAAAIALAILLDMVDRRFRYPDQATNELGLVIAGAIPKLPKGGIDNRSPEQVSQLVEAFRSLRMHVAQSGQAPFCVAVSSPSPGDGKSLVSANLALSFAEAGYRTVLVDGDTRRGALQEMFEIPRSPGLTDYLLRQADFEDIIYPTSHARLALVPSGQRQQRSPELLASSALAQLIKRLRESYDVLVFDTPPLAAGIDAYAISAAAGKMLMVLRIGKTERRMAAAKLIIADRLPIEILGAVLNGVQLEGEYQYYGYSAGYALAEPEPESEGEIVRTG